MDLRNLLAKLRTNLEGAPQQIASAITSKVQQISNTRFSPQTPTLGQAVKQTFSTPNWFYPNALISGAAGTGIPQLRPLEQSVGRIGQQTFYEPLQTIKQGVGQFQQGQRAQGALNVGLGGLGLASAPFMAPFNAAREWQKATGQYSPQSEAGLTAAAFMAGSIQPRNALNLSKQAESYLAGAVKDRSFRDILGRIGQLVETKPGVNRANLGVAGDWLQSVGETLFGKQAVNLTNKQLFNAVQTAYEQVASGPQRAGLVGLTIKNVREKAQKSGGEGIGLKEFAKNATVSRGNNYIAVSSPYDNGKYIIRSLETSKITDADAIARSYKDLIKSGTLSSPTNKVGLAKELRAAIDFQNEQKVLRKKAIGKVPDPMGEENMVALKRQLEAVAPTNKVGAIGGKPAIGGTAPAGKAATSTTGLPKLGISQPETTISPPSSPIIPPDQDLIAKLTQALKEAKPLRGLQEELYTKARGQKLAQVLSARERIPGEKGYHAELGALKGELPKVQYESIRQNFNQESVDRLFDMIRQNKVLDHWDKLPAESGLAKILGEKGGAVPTADEIEKLYTVFGREFTEALLSKRPLLEKLGDLGLQLYNVPRSAMAGVLDFSGTLMQNLLLAYRHPLMTAKNFARSVQYFGSEPIFRASQEEIAARPTFETFKKMGLKFTELGPTLGKREEQFMTPIVEKIPFFGGLVRATSRAYTGLLNRMRADEADLLINVQKALGGDINDPNFLQYAGKFVNAATGRGGLGPLEKHGGLLAQVFFSARKLVAVFEMLDPRLYTVAPKAVRQEATKTALAFVGGGMSILQLSKLAGAEVVDEPTNADFGKIKIGNTRFNIFGSYQQLVVLLARQLKGYGTSSTTGKRFTIGEGYKPVTRLDLLSRFFESKQHPTLSLAFGALRGENQIGQPFNLPVEVLNRFTPMVFSDAYDLYKEHGPVGLLGIIPAILGLPTQTYGQQIPSMQTTPTGKPTVKLSPVPGLAEGIINKITNTPVSNIPQDQWQGIVNEKNRQVQEQIQIDRAKQVLQGKIPPEGMTTTVLSIKGQDYTGYRIGQKFVYENADGIITTYTIPAPKTPTTKISGVKVASASKPKKAAKITIKKVTAKPFKIVNPTLKARPITISKPPTTRSIKVAEGTRATVKNPAFKIKKATVKFKRIKYA